MVQGAAFRILAAFYDADVHSFVELCNLAGYPTDLGGYYIRQLLKAGYLEKIDRGQYRILPKGKAEVAISYHRQLFALKPRLAVILLAQKEGRLVVSRRKVQPFIGVAEWPATVAAAAEPLEQTARRSLQRRLGIEAVVPITLHGFFRRMDTYRDSPFDDKLFGVYGCDISDADVVADTVVGDNALYTPEALATLERPSRALLDIYHFAMTGALYKEQNYELTAADMGLEAVVDN